MKRTPALVVAVLLLAGSFAAYLGFDRYFSPIDDETSIVNAARQPVAQTMRLFWSGRGQHEHPPLSDILLHFWLPVAGKSLWVLRMPSVFLYLCGLVFLALAAEKIAEQRTWLTVLIVGTLWPFAFHFARLAGWYAFSFFLVSLLTWAWLRYRERPSRGALLFAAVVALMLVYTNYYGWVLLACLFFDGWIMRARGAFRTGVIILGILAAASFPFWRAFLREILTGAHSATHLSTLPRNLMLGAYGVYALFASESVAPWFPCFSVPIGLAIMGCLTLTWLILTRRQRLFLLYFAVAFAGLTLAGKVETKRLLFISPWLIIAIATALSRSQNRNGRVMLATCLSVIALLGWVGTIERRWYAEPHFLEPWQELADQTALTIRGGGLVVTNSPVYRFCLNYSLAGDAERSSFRPGFVQDPRVFLPAEWLRRTRRGPVTVLLVEGVNARRNKRTVEVEQQLQSGCTLLESRRLAPDSGSEIKREFFPQLDQPPFRIAIDRFRCP